jgi:hypothetical protein
LGSKGKWDALPRDPDGRRFGDEERPAQLGCLLLKLGVPSTAAPLVVNRNGRMQQKAVAKLVCDIAGLACRAVPIVVQNQPAGLADDRDSRDLARLKFT